MKIETLGEKAVFSVKIQTYSFHDELLPLKKKDKDCPLQHFVNEFYPKKSIDYEESLSVIKRLRVFILNSKFLHI